MLMSDHEIIFPLSVAGIARPQAGQDVSSKHPRLMTHHIISVPERRLCGVRVYTHAWGWQD